MAVNFDDLLNNIPEQDSLEPISKEEYAAMKKAEREQIFALSDQVALKVSESGEYFQQYLDTQSVFDRYSTVNTLLIMAQKPQATRLGSFDYWKKQDGFVKPRQSAISILEPGKEYERKDGGGTAIGYNVKKVFDISQVDTRRIKTASTPYRTDRQLLSALIKKAPVTIKGVDSLPGDLGAMTIPVTGDIHVLRGMEFADTFRSAAQELAYAEVENSASHGRFTAYCASYILCQKFGVDSKDFSFEEAPKVFAGMDAQSIKQKLSEIRGIAEKLVTRMTQELSPPKKTEIAQGTR